MIGRTSSLEVFILCTKSNCHYPEIYVLQSSSNLSSTMIKHIETTIFEQTINRKKKKRQQPQFILP